MRMFNYFSILNVEVICEVIKSIDVLLDDIDFDTFGEHTAK